jgi:hypothetical protein
MTTALRLAVRVKAALLAAASAVSEALTMWATAGRVHGH